MTTEEAIEWMQERNKANIEDALKDPDFKTLGLTLDQMVDVECHFEGFELDETNPGYTGNYTIMKRAIEEAKKYIRERLERELEKETTENE